jgi:hypothetical protein
MISVMFDSKTGILDSKYTGVVTLDQIVDYIVATKENTSYPRFLKILSDATQAEMNFPGDALSTIVDENNKSLERYDTIVDAIVIDSPRETALSLLYKELSRSQKYRFKVFSTREAATEWLEGF